MANPAAGCWDVGGLILPCGTWTSLDIAEVFILNPMRQPAASGALGSRQAIVLRDPNPLLDELANFIRPGTTRPAPAPFVNISVLPQTPAQNPQNPAPPTHTPDACGDMADNAQNAANEALFNNEISGLDPHSKTALANALKAFDTAFTTLYAGRAATSIIAAGRQWINRGAGATINPYWLGETGFKPEFMDTGQHTPGQFVDQTHHYAFYLSVGINANTIGPLRVAQWLHRQQDNIGDANLGKAAFQMGRNLRNSPSGLQNIGDFIRSAICDQNRNPVH